MKTTTPVPDWVFPGARLVELNPAGKPGYRVLPAEVLWVRDGNVGISAPDGYFFIDNSKISYSARALLTDDAAPAKKQRRFLSAREGSSYANTAITPNWRTRKWLRSISSPLPHSIECLSTTQELELAKQRQTSDAEILAQLENSYAPFDQYSTAPPLPTREMLDAAPSIMDYLATGESSLAEARLAERESSKHLKLAEQKRNTAITHCHSPEHDNPRWKEFSAPPDWPWMVLPRLAIVIPAAIWVLVLSMRPTPAPEPDMGIAVSPDIPAAVTTFVNHIFDAVVNCTDDNECTENIVVPARAEYLAVLPENQPDQSELYQLVLRTMDAGAESVFDCLTPFETDDPDYIEIPEVTLSACVAQSRATVDSFCSAAEIPEFTAPCLANRERLIRWTWDIIAEINVDE